MARRVAKNTLFLSAADVSNKLMMFVFYLIAARHLGVSEFGVLSFALAFVTMLSVLTDLGLGSVAAREIARDRSSAYRHVSNAVAIKGLSTVIVIGVIVGLVHLLGYDRHTVVVVYICCFFVLESTFTAYYGFVFQGFERMEFTAMSRVLQTFILIIGALLLSRGPAGAEQYALLYAGAGLVSVAFAWSVASIWFVKPGLTVDLREWKQMLGSALPIGAAAAFVMFYYWSGSTILSKFKGNGEVGIYSAAWRLALGLGFAGWAFSGAIYPVMSRLFLTASDRLTRLVELSIRYALIFVLPIGALGTVLARPVVLLLYGSSYVSSVVVLRFLVWWVAIVGLNSLLSNYFLAINRPRVATLQAAAAMGINVALDFALVPAYGAVGVAIAIVVAEAASLAFLFLKQLGTANRVRVLPLLGAGVRSVLALVPAVAIAAFAVRLHFAVALAASLAVYVSTLVLVRGLTGADLHTLQMMLRGNRAGE